MTFQMARWMAGWPFPHSGIYWVFSVLKTITDSTLKVPTRSLRNKGNGVNVPNICPFVCLDGWMGVITISQLFL